MEPERKKSRKVLFIDDDQILLKSMRKFFEKVGHEVVTATTGKEGIRAFEQTAPDVVVVDLNLPDISGMEVLADLRRRQAMVIMLTGVNDVDKAVQAMRLHAENFLTKPVEMDHLLVSVEKAAEKAELSSENRELRHELNPSVKKFLIRASVLVALAVVSALVGIAIGGEDATDPRTAVPIPIPVDTSATIP